MKFKGLMTVAFAGLFLAGCSQPTSSPTKSGAKAKVEDDHHANGPHGGTVFDFGGGAYHGEFTVDHKTKDVAVFVLDGSAKRTKPIKAETVMLTIKSPPFQIALKSSPMETDPQGETCRFVGNDERFGKVQEFEGTVNFELDGKPFAGDFKEKPDNHGSARHAGMPEGVGGTPAERDLFLLPGGIYTEADIKANGNILPSIKFRGISWPHDDVKPGDKVCPVTMNKADSRCQWTVAGKSYEFCCTPCLDKFVKWAKQQPEKIKDPSEYIQK